LFVYGVDSLGSVISICAVKVTKTAAIAIKADRTVYVYVYDDGICGTAGLNRRLITVGPTTTSIVDDVAAYRQ